MRTAILLLLMFLLVGMLLIRDVILKYSIPDTIRCFAVDENDRVYIGVKESRAKESIYIYDDFELIDALSFPELKAEYCFIITYGKLIIGDPGTPNEKGKEYDLSGNYISESNFSNREIAKRSSVKEIQRQRKTYSLNPARGLKPAEVTCNGKTIYAVRDQTRFIKSYYYDAVVDILGLSAAIFVLIILFDRRSGILGLIKNPVMKKTVRITLIILLSLALAYIAYRVIVPHTGENTHPTRSKLYVNGNLVEDKNVIIYNHGDTYYARLPLLSIVESLGYGVFVESDDQVFFEIGDNKYQLTSRSTLSTDKGDFVCKVPGHDIALYGLKGPPGETYITYDVGYDYYDYDAGLIEILSRMGISPVEITIDPQNKTVLLEGPQSPAPD